MNIDFISKTALFDGIPIEAVRKIIEESEAFTKIYEKGEFIFYTGNVLKNMGLVLSGKVIIEKSDIFGTRSIISEASAGHIFAEVYACSDSEPLMVDAVAYDRSEIMFLNPESLINSSVSHEYSRSIIKNLLNIIASKNLSLTRKINDISPKTIRERLISYLSFQSQLNGSREFFIPFNRQQLADYLCVDRSALSNEISKMQHDGLIISEKNKFLIKLQPI